MAKLNPLSLACCCFWVPSLRLITFLSVWHIYRFGCLPGLKESSTACLWYGKVIKLFLILSDASAFGTTSHTNTDLLSKWELVFYLCSYLCECSHLSSTILVQYVQFSVAKMTCDLTYLEACLIDKINNSLQSFHTAFYVVGCSSFRRHSRLSMTNNGDTENHQSILGLWKGLQAILSFYKCAFHSV